MLTLIMICEESCPPSVVVVRLPGRPADSQFWQISTDSQTAQWNLAPTMSSPQLQHPSQHEVKET